MKENSLQVLLVQDGAADARSLREMFRNEKPGSFELIHVGRISEAETYLATARADIILLDIGSSDGNGIGTVRQAHAMAPGTPLIVLTGLDDEAAAAEALKEGAQDYLIKGQIESRALPRTLRHAIELRRMKAETDLVRAYQMRFKDEFLSHVSHELRSPLNAIYQFVTILLDRLAGELNPQQSADLEIVLRNVQQLQSMINDLFEAGDSQRGELLVEPQPTSPGDAILDTVNTLQFAAVAKEIDLSAELDCPLPSVCADPTRLRQILGILVENAIKFTPANGVVKITARLLEGNLLLEVSDSGCGISPDFIERIFERMFQAPHPDSAGRKGLGLGLYICKDLVTRQGGEIWVTSAPGRGAVFSVTLPVFRLGDLIRPAIRSGSPVTLLVTEIGSQTGWLSNQARAQHGGAVRDVLQQCLYPGQDVLLPRMGFSGGVELFFVVAAADESGAGALVERIRDLLDSSQQMEQAGLIHSTSFRFLQGSRNGFRPESGEATETRLEKLAAEVQQRIDEEISQRMVRDGQ